MLSPRTSLKTSIKIITNLSDTNCMEDLRSQSISYPASSGNGVAISYEEHDTFSLLNFQCNLNVSVTNAE